MKIILVRNGRFDDGTGGLSKIGVLQIKRATELIKKIVPRESRENKVIVARGITELSCVGQSAEIIADEIGLWGVLQADWLDGGPFQKVEELNNFIGNHSNIEFLIIVSDLLTVELFLEHFQEKLGGIPLVIGKFGGILPGLSNTKISTADIIFPSSVFLIDFEAKEIRQL